jgi:hypothetical protein
MTVTKFEMTLHGELFRNGVSFGTGNKAIFSSSIAQLKEIRARNAEIYKTSPEKLKAINDDIRANEMLIKLPDELANEYFDQKHDYKNGGKMPAAFLRSKGYTV